MSSDTFEQYIDKVQLFPGFRSDHSMLCFKSTEKRPWLLEIKY